SRRMQAYAGIRPQQTNRGNDTWLAALVYQTIDFRRKYSRLWMLNLRRKLLIQNGITPPNDGLLTPKVRRR
ncbi:MAG: hypothetical protein ABFE08_16980, partial [Armatimonadia bacterium]